MLNKQIINDFSNIIGKLEISINLDSFQDIERDYKTILKELISWIKSYYLNKNFDIVTHEKSLEIHSQLEEIKWKKITDKNIGMEAMLTDDIFIIYEKIIKEINDERSAINGKR